MMRYKTLNLLFYLIIFVHSNFATHHKHPHAPPSGNANQVNTQSQITGGQSSYPAQQPYNYQNPQQAYNYPSYGNQPYNYQQSQPYSQYPGVGSYGQYPTSQSYGYQALPAGQPYGYQAPPVGQPYGYQAPTTSQTYDYQSPSAGQPYGYQAYPDILTDVKIEDKKVDMDKDDEFIRSIGKVTMNIINEVKGKPSEGVKSEKEALLQNLMKNYLKKYFGKEAIEKKQTKELQKNFGPLSQSPLSNPMLQNYYTMLHAANYNPYMHMIHGMNVMNHFGMNGYNSIPLAYSMYHPYMHMANGMNIMNHFGMNGYNSLPLAYSMYHPIMHMVNGMNTMNNIGLSGINSLPLAYSVYHPYMHMAHSMNHIYNPYSFMHTMGINYSPFQMGYTPPYGQMSPYHPINYVYVPVRSPPIPRGYFYLPRRPFRYIPKTYTLRIKYSPRGLHVG